MPVQQPRSVAVITYFAFALAGMFFLFWGPNVGLRSLLGGKGFIVWNLFLILGGASGVWGSITRKFRIEIIASPLLWSGLCVYGVYTLTRITHSPQPGVIAGLGSIFIGAGFGFLGQGLAIFLGKMRPAGGLEQRSINE